MYKRRAPCLSFFLKKVLVAFSVKGRECSQESEYVKHTTYVFTHDSDISRAFTCWCQANKRCWGGGLSYSVLILNTDGTGDLGLRGAGGEVDLASDGLVGVALSDRDSLELEGVGQASGDLLLGVVDLTKFIATTESDHTLVTHASKSSLLNLALLRGSLTAVNVVEASEGGLLGIEFLLAISATFRVAGELDGLGPRLIEDNKGELLLLLTVGQSGANLVVGASNNLAGSRVNALKFPVAGELRDTGGKDVHEVLIGFETLDAHLGVTSSHLSLSNGDTSQKSKNSLHIFF